MPQTPYYNDRDYTATEAASDHKDDPNTTKGAYPVASDCLSHIGSAQTHRGIRVEKGEMTGRFEMGSTIVLVWESSGSATQICVEQG